MNREAETQRPTVRTVPLTRGAVILLLATGIAGQAAAQFGGGGGGNRRRRRTQPTGASAHPADGGVGAPSRRGRRRTQ